MPETIISLAELPELRARPRAVGMAAQILRPAQPHHASYTRADLNLALAGCQMRVEHVRAIITSRLCHLQLDRTNPKVTPARRQAWRALQLALIARDRPLLGDLLADRHAWLRAIERLDDKEQTLAIADWAKPIPINTAADVEDFFRRVRATYPTQASNQAAE